jgi:hypothetical protein
MFTDLLDFSAIRLGATVVTANGTLTVTGTRYPIGTTADEITRRVVRPEVVELSSDGRGWVDGWHDVARHGAESADALYVEKHTLGGCIFHGFADSVSRRIVQVG